MLDVSPKMAAAMDGGTWQPVAALELITDVLDDRKGTHADFKTVAEGGSQLAGERININSSPGRVLLGTDTDTSQNVIVVDSYAVEQQYGIILRQDNFGYQTVSFTDPFKGPLVRRFGARLSRRNVAGDPPAFTVSCRIYPVDDGGGLLGPDGKPLEPDLILQGGFPSFTFFSGSSIAQWPNATDLNFNFYFGLWPGWPTVLGQRYAFLLRLINAKPEDFVYWIGHTSRKYTSEITFQQPSSVDLTGLNSLRGGSSRGSLRGGSSGGGAAQVPVTGIFGLEVAHQVHVAAYRTDGYIELGLDLGQTPIEAGHWDFLDDLPDGTDIAYTAWTADAAFAKVTSLGAVADGDAITNLSRRYVVRATLTTPGSALTPARMRTPAVDSVNAIFPGIVAGQTRRYIFSSKMLPFSIAPAITKIPQIETRLDIPGYIALRGRWSITLRDCNGEVTRVATETNLKNRPVRLRLGDITAASFDEMSPMAEGVVDDYAYEEGALTLHILDPSIKLASRIPRPKNQSSAGVVPISFVGMSHPQALKQILRNESQIKRRALDYTSFDALPGATWITDRIVGQPVDGQQLTKEIMEHNGAYLTVREEGVLTAIRFPRADQSVAHWDASILAANDKQPEGISKQTFNLVFVFYAYAPDSDDHGGYIAVTDYDAIDELAPGSDLHVSDRQVKGKWLGPEEFYKGKTIAIQIGNRIIKAFRLGLVPFRCRTSARQYRVQVGDFVDITSPVFLAKHQLGMTAKQFMVVRKRPDIENNEIEWDLIEAKPVTLPPVAVIAASTVRGAPPLTVNFNGAGSFDLDGSIASYRWDFDFDGENFTEDATGATPSHIYDATAAGRKIAALEVTDNDGAVSQLATIEIVILAAPVADIAYEISDPTQPLFAVLRSISQGITGRIVKEEWDLSYTGVFTVDVVGPTAVLNLPYQSIDVALRVTDQDGLTGIKIITLAGKAFAPATPTNFFVRQNKDLLDLQWDDNLEGDILGFEARIKFEPTGVQTATFENSDLLFSSARTTSRTIPVTRPYGHYTILLKAINSTKRYSINAVSIFIKILDPQDRNVILTRDEKALGWPGTKTRLVLEVANSRLWLDAPGTIDDMADTPLDDVPDTAIALTSGTYGDGTYETPVIDLGAVFSPIRLSVLPTTLSIPSAEHTAASVEYRISDDNVEWSPYQSIRYGADLAFRYLQVLYTGEQLDNASNIALENLVVTIDVPDLLDSNEDVDVAVGGTAVLFGVVFNIIPSVHTSIQNMLVPHFVDIYSKSKTGFSMKVRVRLPGTGTISTTGTAATTSAAHGLAIGDAILILTGPQAGEYKRVTDVPTSTTATLESAFSADQSGQSWDRGKDVGSGGLRLVDWEAIGY